MYFTLFTCWLASMSLHLGWGKLEGMKIQLISTVNKPEQISIYCIHTIYDLLLSLIGFSRQFHQWACQFSPYRFSQWQLLLYLGRKALPLVSLGQGSLTTFLFLYSLSPKCCIRSNNIESYLSRLVHEVQGVYKRICKLKPLRFSPCCSGNNFLSMKVSDNPIPAHSVFACCIHPSIYFHNISPGTCLSLLH